MSTATPSLFSSSSFFIHIFLSPLLFLSITSGGIMGRVVVNGEMSWCVAKPSSSEEVLQRDLDYACSQPNVKCKNLGGCSFPDTKAHVASYAMNLYYQNYARQPHTCDFQHSALIAFSDPSYSKNCTYPGGEAQITATETWCVAKPAADESVLREMISMICSKIDCGIIRPKGACSFPNTLWNQASVVMNLFYSASSDHNCDFQNAALLVRVDPSYESCNMPGRQQRP